ncbi:hypothetical protein ACH5RR_024193 [Cinchona calisaya]|uniref:F-box domain-containing protein n=1 Tax=Cinchona calisaya TaxID=153742 RepID=A0ABD2ZCV7_9GENT
MGRRKNRSTRLDIDEYDDDSTAVKKEEKGFENLPSDIALEVLSRVDPQTLVSLGRVSLGLCNFIGQPEFEPHHSRNCKAIAGKTITGLFLQERYSRQERHPARFDDFQLRWYFGHPRFARIVQQAGGIQDPSLEFLKQHQSGKSKTKSSKNFYIYAYFEICSISVLL